jgi:hypothetical protein
MPVTASRRNPSRRRSAGSEESLVGSLRLLVPEGLIPARTFNQVGIVLVQRPWNEVFGYRNAARQMHAYPHALVAWRTWGSSRQLLKAFAQRRRCLWCTLSGCQVLADRNTKGTVRSSEIAFGGGATLKRRNITKGRHAISAISYRVCSDQRESSLRQVSYSDGERIIAFRISIDIVGPPGHRVGAPDRVAPTALVGARLARSHNELRSGRGGGRGPRKILSQRRRRRVCVQSNKSRSKHGKRKDRQIS